MLAGGDEKSSQKFSGTMTATARGTMRPNGRSPPFLAIGLFIALCVMGFNYWNLSAKNAEQANEITILNSEKLTARSVSEKRVESLNQQIEKLQRDINTAKAQKEMEINRLSEEKQSLQDQCTRDKATVGEELDECRDLTNELKAKVEGFRCDAKQCESLTAAAREQSFQDMYKVVGIAPLLKLHQADVNLGHLGEQLREEFNAEIQRQQQLAQVQQAGQQQAVQQPNQADVAGQQQNQAANPQGLQQDQLPVQPAEQNKGGQ